MGEEKPTDQDDRALRFGCSLDRRMMPGAVFCWSCRRSWPEARPWPPCALERMEPHYIPRYPQRRRYTALWFLLAALIFWLACIVLVRPLLDRVWPLVPPVTRCTWIDDGICNSRATITINGKVMAHSEFDTRANPTPEVTPREGPDA